MRGGPGSDDVDARLDAAAQTHEEALGEAAAGRLGRAERLVRAALGELEALLPPPHPDIANALDTLAGILAAAGRFSEAQPLWQRSLAAFAGHLDGEAGELVAQMRRPVLCNYGAALVQAGQHAEAAPVIALAVAEGERLGGARSAWAAEARVLLGVWHKMQGRLDEAEAQYRSAALDLAGPGGQLPPALLHNLAGLATARGEHQRAVALITQALAARRAAGEEDGAEAAGDLAGLGDALAGLGRHDQAIERYRQALALLRAGGLGDHPEVAFCLHNLGDALAARGRGDDVVEAEACYRDSLARKQAGFGPAHPEVAATVANLALLLAEHGRAAEAPPLLSRALAITAGLEGDHPVRRGCEALAQRLGVTRQ